MPRQPEPNANNALGSLLQDMLPRGQVRSVNTQAISGQPGLRPDIIITVPGRGDGRSTISSPMRGALR